MTERIPLAIPHLTGNEGIYLQECVDTNYVSSIGPFVDRFEREFAAAIGVEHAVACASGTAALHIALLEAGAGPGKLVAVPTFTFIASANAAAYTGADILLVDSEHETWNLDGELLHDHVVKSARAGRRLPDIVEVVHLLGHPAKLEPILDLRDTFGITVVEDAAEALGATYRGAERGDASVGSIGAISGFSFNGNKVITAGGGGMIATNDDVMAEHARHLTTQARLPGREYVHDAIGFNYRLTNIAAALGVAQLEQLPAFVEAKRAQARRYDELLADLPITRPPAQPWADSSFWLYSVLLQDADRDAVIDGLEAVDIEARPLWGPLHASGPYADTARLGGEVAEGLFAKGISLPSSVGLAAEDQQRVAESLSTILGRIRTSSVR